MKKSKPGQSHHPRDEKRESQLPNLPKNIPVKSRGNPVGNRPQRKDNKS